MSKQPRAKLPVHIDPRAPKKPKKIVPRGPNRPKEITDARKLISRKEAAAIFGCCVDTVKKMEIRHDGGFLEVIKLHPTARAVFYRLEDVRRLTDKEQGASQ